MVIKIRKMIYEEVKPNIFLNNLVRRFCKFENNSIVNLKHTILPDGNFDLVLKYINNELVSIELYGIWTKTLDIEIEEKTTMLIITFKPLAAEYIFKDSIANLLNNSKKLDYSVFGIEKLKFTNLLEFANKISDNFPSLSKTRNRKVEIFEELFNSNGLIRVEQLSEKLQWNSRSINRYFTNEFGLSIKQYANILLCYSSYSFIKNGYFFPEKGYYDQSHFIKEIKRYTGVTPKKLYQNKDDRFLQFKINKK